MVKARIIISGSRYRVEVQRDKFKHWFPLGSHTPSDNAFTKHYPDILWLPIINKDTLL